jgi:hypothetical protein
MYKPLRWMILSKTYCSVCNDIARIEKDGSLAATLKRSLQLKGGVASRLMMTIKTHKGPGDVTFRNIHSSAGNIFAGVGIWVAKAIRKITRELNHFINETSQLLGDLRR